eukprot:525212-Hanusia_phi.AAC.10
MAGGSPLSLFPHGPKTRLSMRLNAGSANLEKAFNPKGFQVASKERKPKSREQTDLAALLIKSTATNIGFTIRFQQIPRKEQQINQDFEGLNRPFFHDHVYDKESLQPPTHSQRSRSTRLPPIRLDKSRSFQPHHRSQSVDFDFPWSSSPLLKTTTTPETSKSLSDMSLRTATSHKVKLRRLTTRQPEELQGLKLAESMTEESVNVLIEYATKHSDECRWWLTESFKTNGQLWKSKKLSSGGASLLKMLWSLFNLKETDFNDLKSDKASFEIEYHQIQQSISQNLLASILQGLKWLEGGEEETNENMISSWHMKKFLTQAELEMQRSGVCLPQTSNISFLKFAHFIHAMMSEVGEVLERRPDVQLAAAPAQGERAEGRKVSISRSVAVEHEVKYTGGLSSELLAIFTRFQRVEDGDQCHLDALRDSLYMNGYSHQDTLEIGNVAARYVDGSKMVSMESFAAIMAEFHEQKDSVILPPGMQNAVSLLVVFESSVEHVDDIIRFLSKEADFHLSGGRGEGEPVNVIMEFVVLKNDTSLSKRTAQRCIPLPPPPLPLLPPPLLSPPFPPPPFFLHTLSLFSVVDLLFPPLLLISSSTSSPSRASLTSSQAGNHLAKLKLAHLVLVFVLSRYDRSAAHPLLHEAREVRVHGGVVESPGRPDER